jgi:Mg2+-importing ATPase
MIDTATRAAALDGVSLREAASQPVETVLSRLVTTRDGLTADEVTARRRAYGANAIRTHHARPVAVLVRQLRSPLVLLLFATAVAAFFLGDELDAGVTVTILALSVGLGFVNEYRAEQAAEALHSQIRHTAVAVRDGHPASVDVVDLVPGDVVQLSIGQIVPADVRLLDVIGLECNESVLTGESDAAVKQVEPVAPDAALADLACCAFLGTVVRGGSATAVVVATGPRTEFGRIALRLGERQPETAFQVGLRQFSGLLVRVAAVLTTAIFVVNVALQRPVIDALLFSLAIAVGITPQLLPAVVSTSLAAGSRQLARKHVLVKRLVCIEDLGDVEVLFTDKTGTLTDGRISFERALGVDGAPSDDVLLLGLLCNEATVEDGRAVGGNPLDVALWEAAGASSAPVGRFRRVAIAPFDYERRMTSVLVEDGTRCTQITKGAPETVLERCVDVPARSHDALAAEFASGSRTIAIATRDAGGRAAVTPDDEHDLTFAGLLVFLDPPKVDAAASLARLAELGIDVKIVTGDNAAVATTVCERLGLPLGGVLTGPELDALDDERLTAALPATVVFARTTPEQKARLVRLQRAAGRNVAFLGDGVNDAVALHAADVGVSVESATDVAKDAADVVLLEKDLGVLADGIAGGRRTFANTIKYVLMGTSSNFGNMFSAAAASAFLSFLPMLPSQILLNNLLYDSSQLTIPADHVDEERLRRPAHWDIGFIRGFMVRFGPISSLFDFVTFAVMLWGFGAGASLFRSGWFVESLATQTLVIFVIRTQRVPFWRSRPAWPLAASAIAVVAVGTILPQTPFADDLGFRPLPPLFFLALVAMVIAYLGLVEAAKQRFFAALERERPTRPSGRARGRVHRIQRRASRWSQPAPLGPARRQ